MHASTFTYPYLYMHKPMNTYSEQEETMFLILGFNQVGWGNRMSRAGLGNPNHADSNSDPASSNAA